MTGLYNQLMQQRDFSVDSTSGTATTHALQEPLANTSSRARQAPSLSLPHSDSPRYPSTSHVVRDNEDPLAPFYEEARTIVFGDDHERDGHVGPAWLALNAG